eukprot:gene13353-biopygen2683
MGLQANEPTGASAGQGASLAHLATPLEQLSDAQKRSLAILEQAAMGRSTRRGAERSSQANPASEERAREERRQRSEVAAAAPPPPPAREHREPGRPASRAPGGIVS